MVVQQVAVPVCSLPPYLCSIVSNSVASLNRLPSPTAIPTVLRKRDSCPQWNLLLFLMNFLLPVLSGFQIRRQKSVLLELFLGLQLVVSIILSHTASGVIFLGHIITLLSARPQAPVGCSSS